MTHLRFDQYTKQFLDEFLAPFGTVERSYEIPGEPKQVDLYFIPNSQTELATLGLLGRIAATPCLLEPYRNQPTLIEVRILPAQAAVATGRCTTAD